MRLSRFTSTQYFDIWEPRWSSQYTKIYGEPVALLAVKRVGTHNEVEFTRTKSQRYQGHWYISGEDVRKCELGSNGVIPCYVVPVSKLEVLERGEPPEPQPEPIRVSQLKLI